MPTAWIESASDPKLYKIIGRILLAFQLSSPICSCVLFIYFSFIPGWTQPCHWRSPSLLCGCQNCCPRWKRERNGVLVTRRKTKNWRERPTQNVENVWKWADWVFRMATRIQCTRSSYKNVKKLRPIHYYHYHFVFRLFSFGAIWRLLALHYSQISQRPGGSRTRVMIIGAQFPFCAFCSYHGELLPLPWPLAMPHAHWPRDQLILVFVMSSLHSRSRHLFIYIFLASFISKMKWANINFAPLSGSVFVSFSYFRLCEV